MYEKLVAIKTRLDRGETLSCPAKARLAQPFNLNVMIDTHDRVAVTLMRLPQ